jgi:hypothetical protein
VPANCRSWPKAAVVSPLPQERPRPFVAQPGGVGVEPHRLAQQRIGLGEATGGVEPPAQVIQEERVFSPAFGGQFPLEGRHRQACEAPFAVRRGLRRRPEGRARDDQRSGASGGGPPFLSPDRRGGGGSVAPGRLRGIRGGR